MRAQTADEIELIVCDKISASLLPLLLLCQLQARMSKENKVNNSFGEIMKIEKSKSEIKNEATKVQMKVKEFKGILRMVTALSWQYIIFKIINIFYCFNLESVDNFLKSENGKPRDKANTDVSVDSFFQSQDLSQY